MDNDQIMVDLDEGRAYCCPSYDSAINITSGGGPDLTMLSQKVDCHLPEQVTEKMLRR